MDNYTVKLIDNKLAYPFLLNIHYAKRIPSITYCYGLFEFNQLVGVISFGTPAGAKQREGIAGKEYSGMVFELNRLCLLNNKPNEASFLVAKALRLLPKNLIIVSYADPEYGHTGIIYQASNFKYYGLTKKRTNWSLKSRPELHGQTVSDLSKGRENRIQYMKDTYGDDFYLKPRGQKHRYIYVTGGAKSIYKIIRYSEEKYP